MQSLKNIAIPAKQGTPQAINAKLTFKHLMSIRQTPVLHELVDLASKHTGLPVRCEEEGNMLNISVAQAPENRIFRFTDELRRLESVVRKPLNEPIMDDDEPVHQGYFYVADGKVRQFIDGVNMTVGRWKKLPHGLGVKEVRRCDMVGRDLRKPKEDKPVGTRIDFDGPLSIEGAQRWNGSGRTIRQSARRPRCSNKIKKVS